MGGNKMKRNKIVSILEYSARNKMLAGILAVSLIGVGGVFLSNNTNFINNTVGINKVVLAQTSHSSTILYTVLGFSGLLIYTFILYLLLTLFQYKTRLNINTKQLNNLMVEKIHLLHKLFLLYN